MFSNISRVQAKYIIVDSNKFILEIKLSYFIGRNADKQIRNRLKVHYHVFETKKKKLMGKQRQRGYWESAETAFVTHILSIPL